MAAEPPALRHITFSLAAAEQCRKLSIIRVGATMILPPLHRRVKNKMRARISTPAMGCSIVDHADGNCGAR